MILKTNDDVRKLVDKAIIELPHLTVFGIGIHPDHLKGGAAHIINELARQQQALYTPESLRAVAACADWICQAQTTCGTINRKAASYRLKNPVQNFRTRSGDPNSFVSVGQFIAAAVGLGYTYKVIDRHVAFNMDDRPDVRRDSIVYSLEVLRG